MTIQRIEQELKKLTTMPNWGQKQNDSWDKQSKFIYKCGTYEELMGNLANLNLSQDFNNYACNRWLNFWSAKAIEKIFCSNPSVEANKNQYDKLVDFNIKGVKFDHKTSVFPKGFGKDLPYARQNPKELIEWLYRNQSKQGRYHTDNRLFLIMHKSNGQHWELKKELSLLQPLINQYVANFHVNKLYRFEFVKGKETLSDIIWATY